MRIIVWITCICFHNHHRLLIERSFAVFARICGMVNSTYQIKLNTGVQKHNGFWSKHDPFTTEGGQSFRVRSVTFLQQLSKRPGYGHQRVKGEQVGNEMIVLAPRHFQWVEGTDLMGAVRPQAPHRSPRQAFGGNFG
jgi:hypothetical protein